MIRTTVNLDGVDSLVGAIDGMTATVKSSRYNSSMLKMVHSRLATEFDYTVDTIAAGAPGHFHHVYEWNMVGNPSGRLWRHNLTGAGNNRIAGFTWKASRVPIPTPEQRAGNPNDPISRLDPSELPKLSGRRYFFYWKAPVMEFNQTVHIVARNSPRKLLFIPTWDDHKIGKEMKPYVFVRSASMSVPGGDQTTGQFTGTWYSWWATSASAIFNSEIQKVIEKDIGDSVRTAVRGARGRGRKSTVSITANSASYQQAKAAATSFLAGKIRTYDREDEIDD